MKTVQIIILLLSASLLLNCNRTTDSTETTNPGTTPATQQEIEEMATEREQQTKQAIEEQIETGDTISTRGATGPPER